jgi:hypothetical protein
MAAVIGNVVTAVLVVALAMTVIAVRAWHTAERGRWA